MKRWQKVTIWIASIIIVLVVGGLFAANYAVDKVLDSMVGTSVDELLGENADNEAGSNNQENPSSTSGGDSEAAEIDTDNPDQASNQPNAISTDDNSASNDGSNPDKPVSNSNEGQTSGSKGTSSNGNGQSGSSGSGDNNSNVGNNSSSNGNNSSSGSSSGYSPEVSTDKAKEVEDNITVSDKAKVVATLMGSLSASDISTLQKLAGGGLSVEEKKQARDLLLEKLTEDQYNDLISIAAKHGLSQGRSYSEVKDE